MFTVPTTIQCDGCKLHFTELFEYFEPDVMPGGGDMLCRGCHNARSELDHDGDEDDLDPDDE